MENLKEYIFNLPSICNNIIDEYIHLEMLCRDTDFYNIQHMFEAIVLSENRQKTNRKISEYYYSKIDYLQLYFNTYYINKNIDYEVER